MTNHDTASNRLFLLQPNIYSLISFSCWMAVTMQMVCSMSFTRLKILSCCTFLRYYCAQLLIDTIGVKVLFLYLIIFSYVFLNFQQKYCNYCFWVSMWFQVHALLKLVSYFIDHIFILLCWYIISITFFLWYCKMSYFCWKLYKRSLIRLILEVILLLRQLKLSYCLNGNNRSFTF